MSGKENIIFVPPEVVVDPNRDTTQRIYQGKMFVGVLHINDPMIGTKGGKFIEWNKDIAIEDADKGLVRRACIEELKVEPPEEIVDAPWSK